MKVITDKQDRFGNLPLIFRGKDVTFEKINNYLWENFQGYKFAIIFDETGDEYEEFSKEVYVYFLDEIKEAVDCYCK